MVFCCTSIVWFYSQDRFRSLIIRRIPPCFVLQAVIVKKERHFSAKFMVHGEHHSNFNVWVVSDYYLALPDSGDMKFIYVEHMAFPTDFTFPEHIISPSIWVIFLKSTTMLIYLNNMNLFDQTFNRHSAEPFSSAQFTSFTASPAQLKTYAAKSSLNSSRFVLLFGIELRNIVHTRFLWHVYRYIFCTNSDCVLNMKVDCLHE